MSAAFYDFEIDLTIMNLYVHPDEITQSLNLIPSHATAKGTERIQGYPAQTNVWTLRLHKEKRLHSPESDPADVIEGFMDLLTNRQVLYLDELSKRGPVGICVCMFSDTTNTAICFNSNVLSACSEAGITLCCDFYSTLQDKPKISGNA